MDGEEGEEALPCELGDSSGEEWIPEFGDVLSGSDCEEDFGDLAPRRPPILGDFHDWCHSASAFRTTHLDAAQLQAMYRVESWHADSVSLLGSRDNFCGPTPGLRHPPDSLPQPLSVFDLYWTPEPLREAGERCSRR